MSEAINQMQAIVDCYKTLTGREVRWQIYEHSLFDFVRAGFTDADMSTVIQHIQRLNRKNSGQFQYSLKLGHILNDHEKFEDMLSEERAYQRNRRPVPTPKQKVMQQFSPVLSENTQSTNTIPIGDALRKAIEKIP